MFLFCLVFARSLIFIPFNLYVLMTIKGPYTVGLMAFYENFVVTLKL